MSDLDDLDDLWDTTTDDDEAVAAKPKPSPGKGAASGVASVPPPAIPDLDNAWGSPSAPAVTRAIPKNPTPSVTGSSQAPLPTTAARAEKPALPTVKVASRAAVAAATTPRPDLRQPRPQPTASGRGSFAARPAGASAETPQPASKRPKLTKRAKRALKRKAQVTGKRARNQAKQARRKQRQHEREAAHEEAVLRAKETQEARRVEVEKQKHTKPKPAAKAKSRAKPKRNRKRPAAPGARDTAPDNELDKAPDAGPRSSTGPTPERASPKALLAFIAVAVIVAVVAIVAGSSK